ncbi:MAG: HAD family hydrolase [Actinophytocola sp.]|uniref:HAD family hydrolase n=1 Tax=Actinophytocola sp. TaxID=1872138 RepID=UPI003C76A4C8
MSRFDAVLFDFDHTLFQFDDSIAWLEVALRRLGRDTEPADVRALYDRIEAARDGPEVIEAQRGCQRSPGAHRAALDSWFRGAGADGPVADALYGRLTDPVGWTPYSDVAATMASLSAAGIPIAIVSNVGWDIRPTLRHHGLSGLVDGFALSCEHGAEKPEQTLFLAACAELGVRPGDALMVGDDPVRDGAAVRSGLHVYLLPDRPMGGQRGLAPVCDLVGAG